MTQNHSVAVKSIVDVGALTPVEMHEGIFFKRDDCFRPFPDIGVSGGKVRQCFELVRRNLKTIKKDYGGTIATACSVHSPQGVIVARVAKHFKLKCIIGCGTATPMKHPALKACKTLGAQIVTLVKSNAYNAVLESRLDKLNKERAFFPIRFGYQAETDADAIIETNAAQVRNIPRKVTAVVIPVGSGVSAQGILLGIRKYRRSVKAYLVQPFGYDREIKIPTGISVRYFKANYEYSKPLVVKIEDVYLDEIYEAKAYDFMKKKLTKALAKEQICFWVIGDSNGIRHPTTERSAR